MISALTTKARRRQGTVEYVVVVGLCALLLVAAVQQLGRSVFSSYERATLKVVASSNANDPALFPVSPSNPYRWNNAAGVWMDSDGVFVADAAVARYEADPAMYRR